MNIDPIEASFVMFQGLQSGVAAKHGTSVHQTDRQQIMERGHEWKKVSLETRMEQLFADD